VLQMTTTPYTDDHSSPLSVSDVIDDEINKKKLNRGENRLFK